MPDTTDELIAERRLHAAVDDGILTEDDIRLSNMMRRLLWRGPHTITYYTGSHLTLSISSEQMTITPEELAVIKRLYQRDAEIAAELSKEKEELLRGNPGQGRD